MPFAALGHSRPLRLATLLVTAYVIAVHIPAIGGVPWLSQAGAPAHSNASQVASLAPTAPVPAEAPGAPVRVALVAPALTPAPPPAVPAALPDAASGSAARAPLG